MAVPKKRMSSSRRDMRRSQHDKVQTPGLSACSNCEELMIPHRVCPACGQYRGRQVIAVEQD
ncbi:MAG: 50S ribosomal protein L32 [Nannocystaceae bacterium]|nr:50S ribosomal protein L32 [Nannocystaceae bacterium]